MNAVVRDVISPDVANQSLGDYQPPDQRRFGVFVQVLIGPADGPGEEAFGLTVCSPSWLSARQRPKGFEFVRSTLVVDSWDWQLVRRAIDDLCRNATGESWREVSVALGRYMSSESE